MTSFFNQLSADFAANLPFPHIFFWLASSHLSKRELVQSVQSVHLAQLLQFSPSLREGGPPEFPLL